MHKRRAHISRAFDSRTIWRFLFIFFMIFAASVWTWKTTDSKRAVGQANTCFLFRDVLRLSHMSSSYRTSLFHRRRLCCALFILHWLCACVWLCFHNLFLGHFLPCCYCFSMDLPFPSAKHSYDFVINVKSMRRSQRERNINEHEQIELRHQKSTWKMYAKSLFDANIRSAAGVLYICSFIVFTRLKRTPHAKGQSNATHETMAQDRRTPIATGVKCIVGRASVCVKNARNWEQTIITEALSCQFFGLFSRTRMRCQKRLRCALCRHSRWWWRFIALTRMSIVCIYVPLFAQICALAVVGVSGLCARQIFCLSFECELWMHNAVWYPISLPRVSCLCHIMCGNHERIICIWLSVAKAGEKNTAGRGERRIPLAKGYHRNVRATISRFMVRHRRNNIDCRHHHHRTFQRQSRTRASITLAQPMDAIRMEGETKK